MIHFGASGSIWESDLSSKNSLINLFWLHSAEGKRNDELYQLMKRWISRKSPTRCILIGPTCDIANWCHPKDRRFLEIARIPSALPVIYGDFRSIPGSHLSESTSLVLALNKESMLLDPFDWATIKHDIREWGEIHGLRTDAPDWTNNLFRERAPLTHQPRHSPCGIPTQLNVFKFFDSRAVIRKEERHLIESGIPALIDRANQHEKWLTTLGILPNQFRKILKRSSRAPENAWDDISRTLFCNGYRIWTKRKHLYKSFGTT